MFMPLVLIFAILLLPGAEVVLLFGWFDDSPLWALAYLFLTAAAGVFLMRRARARFGAIMQGWRQGASPWSFMMLGNMWIAGALLLFPGYLTDILALAVVVIGWFAAPPDNNDGGGTVIRAKIIKEDDRHD